MLSRLIVGLVPFGLFFPCTLVTAQNPLEVNPLAPAVVAPKAPQDPAKEAADLQAEKLRLQKEIEFAKRRVGGIKDLLKNNLGRREQTYRAIDAGATVVAPPAAPPMAPRQARLMLDDERSNHPADVMLLVNGSPIRQGQFDQLMDYQNLLPGDDSAKMVRGQQAVADLIRIETMATAYSETEAEVKVAEAVSELQNGKKVADLVKTYATLRGAAEDGRIEVTRHSMHGVRLEQIAFTTPAGTASKPFRHHAGYVILHVDSVEKGATPELDKVVAHALQVSYDSPEGIAKMEGLLASGQVEIVTRDKQVMELLPPNFRDQDEVRAAARPNQLQMFEKMVAQIEEQMEKLRASDTADDKAMLANLEQRHQQMKERLEKLRAEAAANPATPADKKAEAPKTEPQKKN